MAGQDSYLDAGWPICALGCTYNEVAWMWETGARLEMGPGACPSQGTQNGHRQSGQGGQEAGLKGDSFSQ